MHTQRYQLPPIKKQPIPSQLTDREQQQPPKIGQYIDNSLRKIQHGCYKDGRLCIDGGYGDYRMSIFRLKDRRKRFFQTPTMFTREFVEEVEKLSPPELRMEFHRIVKAKNEDYLDKEAYAMDSQHNKPKVSPWQNQQQQYLYHQYVPKYQRQRWFKKTISLPEVQQHKVQQIIVENKSKLSKKGKSKNKLRKTPFFKNNNSSIISFNSR